MRRTDGGAERELVEQRERHRGAFVGEAAQFGVDRVEACREALGRVARQRRVVAVEECAPDALEPLLNRGFAAREAAPRKRRLCGADGQRA